MDSNHVLVERRKAVFYEISINTLSLVVQNQIVKIKGEYIEKVCRSSGFSLSLSDFHAGL
jgi:hypothetical protein